jgi:hypothetical protein
VKHIVGFGLVLAAGCGKINASSDDAGAPDANLMGTASVVTQNHVAGAGMIGSAAANISVVSLRPNNSMLDMQTTDTNGAGSLMIYPGGSVTAVYPHQLDNGGAAGSMQGVDLVTFDGVNTGDALTFGTRFSQPADTAIGNVSISFPNEGIESIESVVYTPCGERSVFRFPLSVPVYAWCASTPWEVSSFQLALGGGQEQYYGSASTTLANNSGTINGTYGASHVVAASIAGLPAETTSAGFNLAGVINPSVFGDNVTQPFTATTTLGSGATAGTATSNITAFVNGDQYEGQATLSRSANFGSTSIYQMVPTSATTWSVGTVAPPPWINGHQYFSTEAKAEWAIDSTAGASTFDGIVVVVSWSHTTIVNGSNITVPYTWTFILPPTATSVKLPTLPAPFASIVPLPDTDDVNATVTLVEFPSVNGYDALRAVPERDIVCPDCAVRSGDMTSAMINQ